MARRVYLHIGTMKSATTYIQQLCELNSSHLAAAGMLWPAGELRYQIVRDLYRRPDRGVDFTGTWATLAKAMRRHDGDVLISNELLAGVNGGHVRRLVKAAKAEVHVVLTARDHARLVPSHWQTTIKNGRTHTWTQFASAVCEEGDDEEARRIHDWFWKRHDLMAIVQRWQLHVPVERMTLVTVPPPGGDPQGVAHRFGAAIGVDLRGLPQPDSLANTSLGAHAAELMRLLNEQSADVDRLERSHGYRGALGGALAAHADKEPRFALTQRQQDWIQRRAHAANAEIGELGIRIEGSLGDLVPADAPAPGAVDPSDTTGSELLSAAQRGIMGMARTITEQTLQRKEAAALLSAAEQQVATLEKTTERLRRRVKGLEDATVKPGPQPQPSPGRSLLAYPAGAIRVVRRRLRRPG